MTECRSRLRRRTLDCLAPMPGGWRRIDNFACSSVMRRMLSVATARRSLGHVLYVAASVTIGEAGKHSRESGLHYMQRPACVCTLLIAPGKIFLSWTQRHSGVHAICWGEDLRVLRERDCRSDMPVSGAAGLLGGQERCYFVATFELQQLSPIVRLPALLMESGQPHSRLTQRATILVCSSGASPTRPLPSRSLSCGRLLMGR